MTLTPSVAQKAQPKEAASIIGLPETAKWLATSLEEKGQLEACRLWVPWALYYSPHAGTAANILDPEAAALTSGAD